MIRREISTKTQPKHDFQVHQKRLKEFPAILSGERSCVKFCAADQGGPERGLVLGTVAISFCRELRAVPTKTVVFLRSL